MSHHRNVLVTGGCGFIGNVLVDQLRRNALALGLKRIHPLDNLEWSTNRVPDTLKTDVRDGEKMLDLVKAYDVVVHMAAQINIDHSIRDIHETMDINVMGTVNVINACLKHHKQLVFISSSEIYGSSDRPINEEHPLNGQSPYAASKIAADRLCYASIETWPDFDCTIVRPFNTFGPGQRADSYGGVIAKFIKAAMAGEPLTIYGDGNQRRDYTYVLDTVNAIVMAIQGRMPRVVNIATGRAWSINEIAEYILRATGSQSEITHTDPRPGEVRCLIGDPTLAKAYGWSPEYDFILGLTDCIQIADIRRQQNAREDTTV